MLHASISYENEAFSMAIHERHFLTNTKHKQILDGQTISFLVKLDAKPGKSIESNEFLVCVEIFPQTKKKYHRGQHRRSKFFKKKRK